MHVDNTPLGRLYCCDFVVDDQLPDRGHRQRRGSARVGTREYALQQSALREMVDAPMPYCRRAIGLSVVRSRGVPRIEAFADGGKHLDPDNRAARRADADPSPSSDSCGSLRGSNDLASCVPTQLMATPTPRYVPLLCTASAVASYPHTLLTAGARAAFAANCSNAPSAAGRGFDAPRQCSTRRPPCAK